MPITLQYGANPTAALMMAYAGGKNAYRNKQEEEYRRLYMQQQQLQQQALLQREHMQSQYLLAQGQMGFHAGQQRERIGAEQGMLNQRMGAADIEDQNRRALDIWKWGNPPPKQPIPKAPGIVPERDPRLPPLPPEPEQPSLQQIPQEPPPERIPIPASQQPLAAYGLGGRPPATRQDRVTVAAQRRANAQRTRMGYGVDYPMAAQGYLDSTTITHSEPESYTGEKATYDPSTGGYWAPRRKDWTSW